MSQQSATGFGVAHPTPYAPMNKEEKPDTMPSEKQPPGVDESDDFPKSLEEALLGEEN